MAEKWSDDQVNAFKESATKGYTISEFWEKVGSKWGTVKSRTTASYVYYRDRYLEKEHVIGTDDEKSYTDQQKAVMRQAVLDGLTHHQFWTVSGQKWGISKFRTKNYYKWLQKYNAKGRLKPVVPVTHTEAAQSMEATTEPVEPTTSSQPTNHDMAASLALKALHTLAESRRAERDALRLQVIEKDKQIAQIERMIRSMATIVPWGDVADDTASVGGKLQSQATQGSPTK